MNQIIKPFPNDINKDVFGAWLSGFVAGEGSFNLSMINNSCKASFTIALRADDIDALYLIQSYWQCGGVYNIHRKKEESRNRKQEVNFTVHRSVHLQEILVSHFDKFPLFAKKRLDFEVWKLGVELIYAVNNRKRYNSNISGQWGATYKWLASEKDIFKIYHDGIREIRKPNLEEVSMRDTL